jgi:hypothetical protein
MNKFNKFDKVFNSIQESFRLLNERAGEHYNEFYEDFPQIEIKEIIPTDTSGDCFYLHGTTTAEYNVYPGGGDNWSEPMYDAEAEVTDIIWEDMKLMRDKSRFEDITNRLPELKGMFESSAEDKYKGKTYDYDEELRVVTPEDIGQEYYNKAVKRLKEIAEEKIVKEVEKLV